jgi:RHS repeat-associated protein
MSQTVRARYDYDPYGNVTKVSGDRDSVFLYTGHFWDGRNGLYLTLYRAYDPVLGRWLSRDPIEERGGINLYAYVGNNPIRLSDPLGLDWLDDVSNYAAGTGDYLSGGFMNTAGFSQAVFGHEAVSISEYVRELMDTNKYVDKCSAAYAHGNKAGKVLLAAIMIAAGLNGGSNTVAWSGWTEGAQAEAMELGTTLETTEIGSMMNFVEHTLGIPLPGVVWQTASAIYALNASGTVQAVIRNAGEVWTKIEKPILEWRNIPIIYR